MPDPTPAAAALSPERIAEIRAKVADVQGYADMHDYEDRSSCWIAGHVATLLNVADELLVDRERLERRVAELMARDKENEALFRWLLGEEGDFPESQPGRRYNFRTELRQRLVARATPEPSNGH